MRKFGTRNIVGNYGLFQGLYTIAIFVPGLAVLVRRLHDIGKSGLIALIVYIPILIVTIIFSIYKKENTLTIVLI